MHFSLAFPKSEGVPTPNENPEGRGVPSSRPKALLGVVFAALIALGVWAVLRSTRSPETPAPGGTNGVDVALAPSYSAVLLTNAPGPLVADPRWSGVLGVLESMKNWAEANPVCHLLVTTEGLGGKTYAETEMFRFQETDGTNLVTRIKVHLRFPNDVTFLIEKVGEEIIAYLPESDQLVKVDAEKEISKQLGLDLQNPGTQSFLNLLRLAFVETNNTHRALTFAFKPEVLNVPSAASADSFTTLRIDEKGALQTVEQTEGGEHRVMRVRYVAFQQEAVVRAAPQIPEDKPVVTGKAFAIALQEEIMKVREKGNRI